MGVSLAKALEPVRSARVFSANPLYRWFTVTEFSNTTVRITLGRRDGTYISLPAVRNNWENTLSDWTRAEHAGGTFILSEMLYDTRA
jgi:hypothetical protein